MNRHNVRQTTRATETAPSMNSLVSSILANHERIAALLTFPPGMLAVDADANRGNAAMIAEGNRYLYSLLLEAK